MSHITNQALARITELGLDKIRCSMTGAPYATIDSEEILITLEGDIESNEDISLDRLIDSWELRSLAMNSAPMPGLRNAHSGALVPLMMRGQDGQVRVMVYLLSRLVYPTLGGKFDSEKLIDRMTFAVQLHDSAQKWEYFQVAEYVQHLVAIDSFCSMPYWYKLWAFDSPLSEAGRRRASNNIKRIFNDPMVLIEEPTRIADLTGFMFKLMIQVASTDGVAGYSGNRVSQSILYLTAPDAETIQMSPFQKELSQADVDRHAKQRAINANPETKIAWSAIHGAGTTAGFTKPGRVKTPAQTEKKAKEKKRSQFALDMQAAFAELTLPIMPAVAPVKKD